jgi:hypothetical protein
LAAKPVRGYDQDPLGAQAAFDKAQNTRAYVLRKKFGVENVEAKLNGRGSFIDVLAAGAGGTNETEDQFAFVDIHVVCRGFVAVECGVRKNRGAFAMEMRRGIS